MVVITYCYIGSTGLSTIEVYHILEYFSSNNFYNILTTAEGTTLQQFFKEKSERPSEHFLKKNQNAPRNSRLCELKIDYLIEDG